jgi:hypothetical protein
MFIKSEKHKRINAKFAEKERNEPENSMARNGAGTEVTIRRNESETRKSSPGTELSLVGKQTRS